MLSFCQAVQFLFKNKPLCLILCVSRDNQKYQETRTVLCGLYIHRIRVQAIVIILRLVQRPSDYEIESCARRYFVMDTVRRRFNRFKLNTWT